MADEKPAFLITNFGNDWLSNMHEIDLPSAISGLPQGPFWFALVIFGGLGCGIYLWRVYRRYCSNHYRRQAAITLQDITIRWTQTGQRENACRDLALLVRRVALTAWPRTDSAALTGQQWLDFLHNTAAINSPPEVLASLSFLPAAELEAMPESHWQELTQWVSLWLVKHQVLLVEESAS